MPTSIVHKQAEIDATYLQLTCDCPEITRNTADAQVHISRQQESGHLKIHTEELPDWTELDLCEYVPTHHSVSRDMGSSSLHNHPG